jgi:hypothetical protein
MLKRYVGGFCGGGRNKPLPFVKLKICMEESTEQGLSSTIYVMPELLRKPPFATDKKFSEQTRAQRATGIVFPLQYLF